MKDAGLSEVGLIRTIKDAGFKDTIIKTSAYSTRHVVTGDVYFKSLPCGIDLHCSDTIENVNGSSTSLIDACMSITILFEGQVSFVLSNKRYHFKVEDRPLVFINLVSDEQLFTRHFFLQRKVKKLNVSVTKEWLLARCRGSYREQVIRYLFGTKQVVYELECKDEIVNLASVLLDKSFNMSTSYMWQVEQKAFQLFSKTFELFLRVKKTSCLAIKGEKVLSENSKRNYETEIEKILFESSSLDEISHKLGASISTLQRHFKTHHQLTLKAYIRNQKLEYVRRALIFEQISIGEASYIAGYNHVSNFTSAFKKYFSITPAALQSQYKI